VKGKRLMVNGYVPSWARDDDRNKCGACGKKMDGHSRDEALACASK